jgi:hypothetical protein
MNLDKYFYGDGIKKVEIGKACSKNWRYKSFI